MIVSIRWIKAGCAIDSVRERERERVGEGGVLRLPHSVGRTEDYHQRIFSRVERTTKVVTNPINLVRIAVVPVGVGVVKGDDVIIHFKRL